MFLERHYFAGYLVFCAALALSLAGPAGAIGSSGEFTRAEANADWTGGSIAGSVTWTGCEHPVEPPQEPPGPGPEGGGMTPLAPRYCAWTPYVTVGPGFDASECAAPDRHLGQLGDGISLVWSGGETEALGTVAFDLSAVPLSGISPHLACISLIETAETGVELPCVPPGPPLPPGWHCPFRTARTDYTLAAASLLAPPVTDATQPATARHRRKACARRIRHAHRHPSRSVCVRRRHHHHRRHLTHS